MSGLRFILFNMLHRAIKESGAKIVKPLRGGLTITILVYQGRTWLALSRDDIAPSDQEIETVRAHFPYVIPDAELRLDYWSRPECFVMSWDNTDITKLDNKPPAKTRKRIIKRSAGEGIQLSLFEDPQKTK